MSSAVILSDASENTMSLAPVHLFLTFLLFRVGMCQLGLLAMVKLLDPLFPLHCFRPGIEFFYVDEVFGLVHSSVPCALAVQVQPETRFHVFRVSSVKAVSLATDDVDIIGRHLKGSLLKGFDVIFCF